MLDIYFENNDTVAFSWEEAITIEETGMYYLWFVICDDELSAATVRGQTTWKNPTGAPRPPAERPCTCNSSCNSSPHVLCCWPLHGDQLVSGEGPHIPFIPHIQQGGACALVMLYATWQQLEWCHTQGVQAEQASPEGHPRCMEQG